MFAVHNILIPLDLAHIDALIMRNASKLVDRFDARVVLLHVTGSNEAKRAMSRLEELATTLGYEAKCLVAEGRPAQAIARVAHDERCDLIVLFPRAPIASVSKEVLVASPCAVWSFPRIAEDVDIHNIVCGIDFTTNEEIVVPYAAALAQACHAKLTLAHVVPCARHYGPGGTSFDPRAQEGHVSAARERLERVIQETHADASTIVESDDDVVGGLNSALAKTHAELLVIGRRPRAGGLGGNCYPIVSNSKVPVLAMYA